MTTENLFLGLPGNLTTWAMVVAVLLGGYLFGRFASHAIFSVAETSGIRRRLRFGLEKEAKKLGFNIDFIYVFAIMAKYIIYAVSIFIALSFIHVEAANLFLAYLIPYLPNFIGALITILFGSALIEILADLVKFKLRDPLDSHGSALGVSSSISTRLAQFVKYFLYATIGIMTLSQLGFKIDSMLMALLLFGLFVIIILSILFLFFMRDKVTNLSAGIQVKEAMRLRAGDRVEIDGLGGEIERIDHAFTVVKEGNKRHFIPNSRFTATSFTVVRK